jgi:hypothetical protein
VTRIIAFSSFLLLIPFTFYFCGQQAFAGYTKLDYLLDHVAEMLIVCAITWTFCFVLGHAIWIACRIYVKVLHSLVV